MRIFVFMAICTSFIICIMYENVYAATKYSVSQDVPFGIETKGTVKDDYFIAGMQLILRDGDLLFDKWDKYQETDRQAFEEFKQEKLEKLEKAYLDEFATVSSIGHITLEYITELPQFRNLDMKPIVEGDTIIYSVPDLEKQIFTYMPIRAITSVNSAQYRFKHLLSTDERGYLRYGDAYSIALGSYYGVEIGTIYDIFFEDGTSIRGVSTDNKSDLHTDPTHRYADGRLVFDGTVGNVLEFVMNDESGAFADMPLSERMSAIQTQINKDFTSPVVEIRKVGKVNVVF